MTVYTSGDWQVRAGREDEFVAKWHELAEASLAEIEPDARSVLLRDREDPRHFRSFGEFRNETGIVKWRDGAVFGHRLGELTEMLEHAATSVYEVVDALGEFDLR